MSATGTGPGVAIILRTRDRPVLLARALAGILAQTHRCWHLVLVNGGAPAPVEALAATYATAFGDRLTVLHAGSPDPDAAAERGLSHPAAAGAAMVALHDDDDAWQPDFLRAGLAALAEDPSQAAVASQAWHIDERMEDGGTIEEARREGFSATHPLDLAAVLGTVPVPLICLLARRTALDRMRTTQEGGPDYAPTVFAAGLLLQGDVAVLPRRLAFCYRRSTRSGAYANRSEAAEALTRQRNAMLRALAAREPALPGLVPAMRAALAPDLQRLLDRLDRNAGWGHGRHQDLQERLVRIEAALESLQRQASFSGEVLQALHRLLRPARRAWRLMEPPRRLLARLRGRV